MKETLSYLKVYIGRGNPFNRLDSRKEEYFPFFPIFHTIREDIMAKLFFFFIDGIGIGENDPQINPMHSFLEPYIGEGSFTSEHIPQEGREGENYLLLPIDAVLDTPGVPQSATGQTTIMTGKNASKQLGYHLYAFPNEELVDNLKQSNLFIDLTEAGVSTTCANLYSRDFFSKRKKRRKNMLPVSALSVESAGIPFRYIHDYHSRRAIFADITNRMLKERGYDISIITPQEAATRVLGLFDTYDFVFFEYFLTDQYGHSRSYSKIKEEVATLNQFIGALAPAVDYPEDPIDILIVSDHGNAEDIRTGDHTYNYVPFFFSSRRRSLLSEFKNKVRDLSDVRSAILSSFGIEAQD